ncbi:biopolymer transporter ExbD [candidate division KSB1 bacterium]|nr:MAG: biopolymer transporter ExbD [candidate division KSB1 bacterium]
MEFKEKKKRKIFINITSLIDVMFLLLIFFMVTSTFIEKPGMDLELPDAETAVLKEVKDLVLTIDRKERVFINGEPVDINNVPSAFYAQYKKNPQIALIIEADKRVDYGLVVSIMDIAKKTGIKKLILATKEKSK